MTGGRGSAGYSSEDRSRRSEQARSQFRIKGWFARGGPSSPAAPHTAVEYNLDVEEDIKPSAEDLGLSRCAVGGPSASRLCSQRLAAVDKGKGKATDSAAAKKKTATPHSKPGRGSTSTRARKKVNAHAYQ
jgi:hypothetical protein